MFFYGDVGPGIGSPFMIRAAANLQFEKRHEWSVGYGGYTRTGREVPAGWNNPSFFGTTTKPQETFSALLLSYGYVLYSRKRPTRTRYVLRAGIASGALSTPVNFRMVHKTGLFGGDLWENDLLDRRLLAVTVNPVVQFTPMKGFGLSAGLYGIFSGQLNGAGITGSLLFGKVSNTPYIYKPKKRGWGRRGKG